MTTSTAPAQAQPENTRARLILTVCCLAQFMVILDLSIVNIALPSIQTALLINSADLQWVVDAYAIMFAGFLMLAGRTTDIFGQRRMFTLALAGFGIASLICGLAPNDLTLILARGAQGLAGAGMAAASLAIITATFPPGPERMRAIALWGAMNGVGGAAGVLAGGVLTDVLSWRWIFLVNVPFAFAGAVLAWRVVADRVGQRDSFDLLGALVLTSGLLIATYGGVEAGSQGFTSPHALVPIAIGSILLTLFPVIERRAKDPLVPVEQLTRDVKSINVIVVLFSSSLFAMWFASSLYLQQVLALSALETGLTFLPMTAIIFLAARPAGKLAGKAGIKPVLAGGLTMLAVGLLLFSRINAGGMALQYVVLPGLLVSLGIGFSVVSSTIAATQFAGPAQAGLASSLVNTARQVGGGLGLAVLLSVAAQHSSGLIGDGEPVPEALTEGFSLAFLIGAGLVATAAILTVILLPGPNTEQRPVAKRVLSGVAAAIVVFAVLGTVLPRSEEPPHGAYKLEGTLKLATEPNLHPPELLKVTSAEGFTPPKNRFIMTGNFLDVTKAPMVGQSGPLMLDYDLQPVWYKPVPVDLVAANLDTYTYDGQPVLAWWEGIVGATGEIEEGTVKVVDQSYREVAQFEGKDGWLLTLHALYIDGKTAWVTANKNIPANLSSEGGVNNGVLMDSALQQYDLETGELLYSWDASDHIKMSDSDTAPPPNGFPWDAYHINSLQLTDDGKALVSMRNTSAIYLFDLETGEIEWTLGGKNSSFELDPEAEFEWQHDAVLEGEDTVTLFDNHCCRITGAGDYLPADRESRGLVLKLDKAGMRVSVEKEYTHGATFQAQYMGNLQKLDDGNLFVGWGQVPFMSEYNAEGELLWDAAFPVPNMTYRAHVKEWVGKPTTKPKAVVADGAVKVSWNGATEVETWRVMSDGRQVAEAAREGFETTIPVQGSASQFQVQALDASGQVLGTSEPVKP